MSQSAKRTAAEAQGLEALAEVSSKTAKAAAGASPATSSPGEPDNEAEADGAPPTTGGATPGSAPQGDGGQDVAAAHPAIADAATATEFEAERDGDMLRKLVRDTVAQLRAPAGGDGGAPRGARQIRVDVDGALAAEETRLAQALASRLAIPGSPEQWSTVAQLRRGVKTDKLEDLDTTLEYVLRFEHEILTSALRF